MLTLLLYLLLAVVAATVLFLVAVFLLPRGEQIAPPVTDVRPWQELPQRPLEPADVAGVRLPVTLRGYRFAETDLLLDRLTEELRVRDEEIERLRESAAALERPYRPELDEPYRPESAAPYGRESDDSFRPEPENRYHPIGDPFRPEDDAPSGG